MQESNQTVNGWWTLGFVLVLSCSALLGCGTNQDRQSGVADASSSGDGRTAGDIGAVVFAPCASSAECLGGELCVAGLCREACAPGDPCEGPLSVCDETNGYCVGCLADDDCGENLACVDSLCEFYCESDAACAEDEYCNEQIGKCRVRECNDDSECPGGFNCEDYNCQSLVDIICAPRTVRCSESGDGIESCNGDGTVLEEEPCEDGQVCRGDEAQPACVPVVCEANAVGCEDDATAFLCSADGTVQTSLPCGSGQYCTAGSCRDQVCEPRSTACQGDVLVTCNAIGSVAEASPCSETSACRSNGAGCSCLAGACELRVCTPESGRCAGPVAQQCSDSGLEWETVDTCSDEELCLEGRCLPRVCEAGSVVCAGETRAACSADGTSLDETNCAATGRVCEVIGVTASCVDRVCTPGTATCGPDGRVQSCNNRGTLVTESDCPSTSYCEAGACLPQICSPGESSCVAGRALVCNTNGSAYAADVRCLLGCDGSTCAVGCGDGIRQEDEACDDGNRVDGDGCAPDCTSEVRVSCAAHLSAVPGSASGVYSIDPDADGPVAEFDVYCDMESAGGGWTLVVAQFEQTTEPNWNRGTTETYDPSLVSGSSFALSTEQIPGHSQTAFGKDTEATFVDYVDYVYTTGNLEVTTVAGLGSDRTYQIHRNSENFHYRGDPEQDLLTSSTWRRYFNQLTFDQLGGENRTWLFAPNATAANERGFSMLGARDATAESYAWTVWVR